MSGAIAPPTINPDNPPWSVPTAIFVWLVSVFLLYVVPSFTGLAYALYRLHPFTIQALADLVKTDPNFILFSVAGMLPVHLITFIIVWGIVTQFGKRPFWQTLGWSWGAGFGFWTSAGLAIILLFLGILISNLIGGGETQLDQIIKSSTVSRFAIAFFATVTAPFVEELVYRGVLYSALRRAVGMLWAVIAVGTLFASIHLPQYNNNLGAITAVAILSFALTYVRARTSRLLPCFIIHLVFNGLQSAGIILDPYIQQLHTEGNHKTALITIVVRLIV